MITQQSTLTNTLKPSSRRSRTKLRKPKFLHLHLISAVPPPMPTTTNHHHKQLINLFPLHPENINKALDEEDHNMAACIFSSCDDVDGAATTLTGILCSSGAGEQDHYTNNPSPSSSVNYADEEVDLVRTAMRRNNKTERNDNDNDNDDDLKWVCYSEVVKENKKKIKIKKEVMVRGLSASSSSSTSSYHHYNHNHHHHHDNHHHDHDHDGDDDDHGRKLVLKLDYEKIMNSWVNKGPLYINSNNNNKNPDIQTVPELQEDDFFLPSSTIGLTQCERENGGNEGSWTVPEIAGIENNDTDRGDDILQAVGSNTMIHHREASVQRYKEKRRNRLFAKTIRYEVRKLNAEKRPRIKGRFVKRN